jgi:hypothetical protein
VPDLNLDQRLSAAPTAGLGQRVPEAIHTRVEELRNLVYGAGHDRPTKAKMIAAILLAATPDAEQLAATLASYDRAYVRDALLSEQSQGQVVSLPSRTPGPRRGDLDTPPT